MAKPTRRVCRGDGVKRVANGVDQASPGASTEPSQVRFGLRPGVLDRIEVRRVGRQELQAGAGALDGEAHLEVVVNAEVVPDDDIARPKERSEEVSRPHPHRLGVHGSGQKQGRMHAVERQCRDQREGLPTPAGNVVDEPLAARCPPVGSREREVDPALIHEPEPFLAPALLALAEQLASSNYVRALPLRGLEGLFFRVMPSRRRLRHIVVSLTATAVSFASSSDSSTSVASGRFAASLRSRRSVAPFTSRTLPGAFPGAGSPVSRTWIRSFRTKLALTAKRRPTRSDELSSESASKILSRKSNEIAAMKTAYHVS